MRAIITLEHLSAFSCWDRFESDVGRGFGSAAREPGGGGAQLELRVRASVNDRSRSGSATSMRGDRRDGPGDR